MATLGMTKLEAVNGLLRSVDIRPVSALDPGGSSEEAEAERVLDDVITLTCAEGFPSNMTRAKSYTAADIGGGVYKVTFGTTVLRVECVAPGRYAGQVTIREDKAYLIGEGTEDFGSAITIYADIYEDLTWDQLPQDVKSVVYRRAIVEYRRLKMFNLEMEQMMEKDVARAELNVDKGGRSEVGESKNLQPFVFGQRSES